MSIIIIVVLSIGFGIGIGMMIAADMIDRQDRKREEERIKQVLQSPNGGIHAPIAHVGKRFKS